MFDLQRLRSAAFNGGFMGGEIPLNSQNSYTQILSSTMSSNLRQYMHPDSIKLNLHGAGEK
jgi:hypothetical protein